MSFLDNISDFYHWMAQFDEVNARSRTNYISLLSKAIGLAFRYSNGDLK